MEEKGIGVGGFLICPCSLVYLREEVVGEW
jgi:hypothetical protein